MNIKKKFILIIIALFCVLLMTATQAYAALTAKLDRDRITEGETVRLTIEADGKVSAMPDTRALENDFEITGTMSGSRVNIVNGNMDSRTNWTISLMPKRSGKLTIPQININGEYTPELTLHVNAFSAGDNTDTTTPIFLETEVDKTNPYVQGMVRYTQRVFFAVDLAQGSLSEPEHENAMVQKLGDDREYQTTRNGRTYHVIEREFVIFPQTSGPLVIPAAVLNAQIPDATNRRDPFFDRFFTNTRPVRLRGEAITLEVRPRPDHSKSAYWLPSEAVELHETWQPEDHTVNIGDPITRNITIKALGVTGEQLPELQLKDPDGFKLYPDRTQANTQNLPHTVQGEKTLHLAYMPTHPGKHTLPEFTLHWWDTTTDSEKTATLPARTIEVAASTNQQHQAAAPSAHTDLFASQQPETATNTIPFSSTNDASSPLKTSPFNHTGWFWATLFFATLWLMTLGLWWRKRQHLSQQVEPKNTSEPEPENSRKARKLFLTACQENNARQARSYLLKWAALHWPQSPPKGLEELASRLNNPAIHSALAELDRALYQNDKTSWNGQELAQRVSKLPQPSRGSHSNNGNNALPGLYR